jgi:isopentenyldiphosphate isomerase
LNKTDNQEEILIVVDENDIVLDYLPRSEVHAKNLLHRTISVVIFNSKGEIVLQKRSLSKDTNPGMLGNAVGGHVNKGESYEDAAKKEAKEELKQSPVLTKILKTILEDPSHRTMTTIYKATADGPFEYNKDEIDKIITMNPADLPNHADQIAPSGKLILQALGVIK